MKALTVLYLFTIAFITSLVLGDNHNILEFTARLQTIDIEDSVVDLFSEDPTPGGHDYLLHLDTIIARDDPRIKDVLNEEAVLITVVDRSGSMQGTPWKQVQEALVEQLRMVEGNENIESRVIIYNTRAEEIDVGDLEDTKTNIGDIQAEGATNFVSAFDKIRNIIDGMDDKRNIVILMMTDGMDTVNNLARLKAKRDKLERTMAAYDGEVVVNVLGFGDHDEEFLESLTFIGKSDGTYSYVSYKEGPASIRERMTQMVESVSRNIGRNVYMSVEIKSHGSGFLADRFGKSSTSVMLPAGLKEQGDGLIKISTRKFIRVAQSNTLPSFTVRVVKSLDLDAKPLKAEVTKTIVEHLKESQDILNHNLKKLRTCVNFLTSATAATDFLTTDSQITSWYNYIDKIVNKLSHHVKDDDDDNLKLLNVIMKATKIFRDVVDEDDDIERTRRQRSMAGDYMEAASLQHNQVRYRPEEELGNNQWVDVEKRKVTREARYGGKSNTKIFFSGDFSHDEL